MSIIKNFMDQNALNQNEISYFENMSIGQVKYLKKEGKVIINLYSLHTLPFNLYQRFVQFIKIILGTNNVVVKIESSICQLGTKDISEYYDYYIKLNFHQYFHNTGLVFHDRKITLLFADQASLLLAQPHLNQLEEFFKSISITYPIELKIRQEVKPQEISVKVAKKGPIEVVKPKTNYNKKIVETLIKIEDLKEEINNVRFVGKVFKIDQREVGASSRLIQTIYVCDENSATICKRFESKRLSKDEMNEVAVNKTYMIHGSYHYDKFARENQFFPTKMEELSVNELPNDECKEKRVELHAHTNKSEMDGIDEASTLIDIAINMGHKGIAITDHVDVQAFPKAQSHVEKYLKSHPDKDFKLVYGVEMNLCKKDFTIVRNPDDRLLKDVEYCVFDLETTGLSAYYDYIIEFGGVIVKNGMVIDSLQKFIKPPIAIPTKITELTHITNNDVADSKSFEEAYSEIAEFIGDRVLVAHNATFDYNFLNESLLRMKKPILKNAVIDTLDLARAVFPKQKRFNLGTLCKKYKVNYDSKVAHRADYDAEVLSSMFNLLLKEKLVKNCQTLNDLQRQLQNPKGYIKNRSNHVIVVAKNQDGIKDLYKLVSLSLTDRLAVFNEDSDLGKESLAEARIFKEDLQQARANLSISASCQNSEIFMIASEYGDKQLREAMQFYDYIEVQPLENYRNLYQGKRAPLPDRQRVKDIVKRIIYTAKELNIPVVATGDVHYGLKSSKIYRDVYISAKGIGNARHPLYMYNEEDRRKYSAPDQHFRTTQEMLDAFKWLSNSQLIKELVIDNPNMIFDSCDYCKAIKTRDLFPPIIEDSDKKLTAICYDWIKENYGDPIPQLVKDRIEKELHSIIGNGYAVIYYISHLLVKRSNEDGYLVGSRGSVGSSFAATASKITEVNPLIPHYRCPKCKHVEWITDGSVSSGFDLPAKNCPNCNTAMIGDGQEIPFETFLGFEGDKTPDIDLNFSGDYQEKAHLFIREMLGEDFAFRAGTLGTVAEKTAFGYALGYTEEMGIEDMPYAQKQHLATGCEGVKRTTGQHPGGIVSIPQYMSVYDFTPIQYPANNPNSSWKTTHFEYHEIESNLLKFDILGHVDPTAMRLLQTISGIDPTKIPMNDPATMSIFSSSKALKIIDKRYNPTTGAAGLPEFGTKFVRGILEITKPVHFSDLVRISGLSHGTDVWNNNAKDLIEHQNLTLSDVIGCRDDIMSDLLHYGLEPKEAFTIMEFVRKGRGLKPEWVESMKKHQVPEWYIDSCEKIKYMFPKAHAVAYVIMAIRIAWFKVHHPEYYYVSYFSLRCDAFEIETMIKDYDGISKRLKELSDLINSKDYTVKATKKDKDIYSALEVCLEMVARGYRLSNIDLNKSKAKEFLVSEEDHHVIIPPFVILDGLGENVAKTIIAARNEKPFLSIQDLQNRSSLSKTLIERLKHLGVLDNLPDTNQISLF